MPKLSSWTRGIHHDGSEIYVSNPLPKIGETVTLKLRIPKNTDVQAVFIRAMLDGEFHFAPMKNKSKKKDAVQWWEGELPIKQHHIDYRFAIVTKKAAFSYTAQGIRSSTSPDFESFIILGDYSAPLWVRDTVYYQIFPERFENGDPSNDVQDNEYSLRGHKTVKAKWGDLPTPWKESGSLDFFGGDLQGITQRLDYLSDLGVNGLYLCPIFEADTNHKYDVKDYFNVDPHFGGNEALAELREESQKRNIKLMLDMVQNHCSFQHPWVTAFTEANNTETAEYFFYDEKKKTFETWLGVPLLIKLNYGSQKLRDVMYRDEDSAMKKWLKPPYSIDAWRMDVANMTGNRGEHQLDHEVWREVRECLRETNEDVYLIGEYFQDGTMHIQGDELDATMNYQGFNLPMRDWLGGQVIYISEAEQKLFQYSTEDMTDQWQRFMGAIAYPIALQQFNQLDSHDTTRILHVTKGDKDLVRLGLALMMGFPGVPCIYYGTEIGMDGARDPDNRRCMPWDKSQWDTDMLDFTKKLIALRQKSHALKNGGFELLHAKGDVVAYRRQSSEQDLIIIGYRGTDKLTDVVIDVSKTDIANKTKWSDWLSDNAIKIKNGKLTIKSLKHGQALILEKA